MNENIVKRNNLFAAKIIKGLESRNMSGYYAESKEEALKKALELIPEGSTVTMGGAMSVHEIGLFDALKTDKYKFIDRDEWEDKRAAMLAAYDADVFLSSANAMTDDGVLINIDGNEFYVLIFFVHFKCIYRIFFWSSSSWFYFWNFFVNFKCIYRIFFRSSSSHIWLYS